MPICELMHSGYSSSSYSWPPHESSYDSRSQLWSRSDHHLDPKSSSLQNLSIRKKSSLDDVMREFQMNGSDSPYNPEDNLFWSRQSAPGELSGLGPGAAYLRQKSWPEPERSPAARLPRARARPRSLHDPRWDYAEAKFAASMPVSYENETKFTASMPVSYENVAKFAASMPVSYENEAKFAASMPVSYENEAKFAASIPVSYENKAKFAAALPVSYESETKFTGNETKFATSIPVSYGTESKKFATSTPIFDDVPPAPFLPSDEARLLTGEQTRALTGEQARVLHSLPDGVLYSLLRGIRAERRANTPQECRFCKNNGERQAFYRSHALKDAAGRVSCPVLRAFVCRRCGARGDAAHTIKYCPYSTNEERIQSAGLVHSMRMASGRRRQQRVAPSDAEMSDYTGLSEAAPSILPDKNVYNYGQLDPMWAALEQKLSLH